MVLSVPAQAREHEQPECKSFGDPSGVCVQSLLGRSPSMAKVVDKTTGLIQSVKLTYEDLSLSSSLQDLDLLVS